MDSFPIKQCHKLDGQQTNKKDTGCAANGNQYSVEGTSRQTAGVLSKKKKKKKIEITAIQDKHRKNVTTHFYVSTTDPSLCVATKPIPVSSNLEHNFQTMLPKFNGTNPPRVELRKRKIEQLAVLLCEQQNSSTELLHQSL